MQDISAILKRFEDHVLCASPFADDSEAVRKTRAEAETVVRAFLSSGTHKAMDLGQVAHREPLALFASWVRRVAELGTTPTAVIRFVDGLDGALTQFGETLSREAREALGIVLFEAYVHTREEVVRNREQTQLAALQPVLRLSATTFGLILCGDLKDESVSSAVEELGRALLRANADTAIVDVTNFRGDGDAWTEAANVIPTARMLGATCVMVGVPAARAGMFSSDPTTTLVARFDEALAKVSSQRSWLPFLKK